MARPVTDARRDPRYSSRRWQKLRRQILARDLFRCQVAEGCDTPANIADHINPVYVGMPDAEFYDPANLRASCRRHNWARGVAARLEREAGDEGTFTNRPASTRPSLGLGKPPLTSVHWATVRR